MSQTALQREEDDRATPETKQSQGLAAPFGHSAGQDGDMLRRAELEAAFAMFGTLEDSQYGEPAHASHYANTMAPAPANDAGAERRMPELARRGVHIDPKLPIQLIKTLDWLIVIAAAEVAARWGAGVGLAQMNIGDAVAFIITAVALKAGLWLTDVYRTSPATIRAEHGLGGLTLGAIIGLAAANALAPNVRDAGALSATLPFAAMLLAGLHAALAVWMRAAHRRGVFAETVVIIGATNAAERFARRARKMGDARIVAIADDRCTRVPDAVGETPVCGDIETLLAWEGLPHVDRIVIAVTQKAETRIHDLLAQLKTLPNRIDLLLDYQTHDVRGRGVERLGGAPMACISGRAGNTGRALVKRAQDLAIGTLLLALFALPMAVIAIAIKLESKGPALYRQRRHGLNNRIFTVLKFRTMRHDPSGQLQITRWGKLLRHTGLDALPMLFNVLHGEMSLVGPRPHAVGMTAAERALDDIIAEYAHRHRVKPGVTGWAQVNGASGALLTPACVRKRVRLDLEYVARASLWFDLQILARSLSKLIDSAKRT
jgi:exopolysaccharide biosynthesis polyprenyl glycosylphosphotransferase